MKYLILLFAFTATLVYGQTSFFDNSSSNTRPTQGFITTDHGYLNYRYIFTDVVISEYKKEMKTELTFLSFDLDTLKLIQVDSAYNAYKLQSGEILFYNKYGKYPTTVEVKIIDPAGSIKHEFSFHHPKHTKAKYIGDFSSFNDQYLYRFTEYTTNYDRSLQDILYILDTNGQILESVKIHNSQEFEYHNQHYRIRNFGRDGLKLMTLGTVRLKKEKGTKTGSRKEAVLVHSRPYHLVDSVFLFSNGILVDLHTETFTEHDELRRLWRLGCIQYVENGIYSYAASYKYKKESVLYRAKYDSNTDSTLAKKSIVLKGNINSIGFVPLDDQSSIHLLHRKTKKREYLELLKMSSKGKPVRHIRFSNFDYQYSFLKSIKLIDGKRLQIVTKEKNTYNYTRYDLWKFDTDLNLLNEKEETIVKEIKIKKKS